jgi:hypothetical protein
MSCHFMQVVMKDLNTNASCFITLVDIIPNGISQVIG